MVSRLLSTYSLERGIGQGYRGEGVSDLKVDYEALADSERTLSALKSAFDHVEDRVRGSRALWGHSSVAEAMAQFGGNWDHHRRLLSEEIQAVGEKTSQTLTAFRDADAELAKSFDASRPR